MNKRILLLWMFCIGWFSMQAQEVLYSAYEKFDLRSGDFSVIGKTGNRIYTYRAATDGFFLDAYNDSMFKVASVLLDFFPNKIYETKFINYPDKLLVLYQAVEGNKVVQYAALLDTKGRLLKNPLKLTEAKTGIFGPNKNYFSTIVSDDKSQILIYRMQAKGRSIQMVGVGLDTACNVTGRSSASFVGDNDLAIGEGVLDDKGNFYVPIFSPIGSKNYNDQYWMLTLPQGTNSFISQELPLSGKYIANSYLKMDNYNSRIYIGGFFADKKNGSYDGVIYSTFETSTGTFSQNKQLPFDDRIRMATGERNKKRAFDNYQPRQIIVKKGGGFVLLSEEVSIVNRPVSPYYTSYYASPMMAQSVREYYYNDILALSYDGDGVNEWFNFIHKSQYSQEDGGIFSSYSLINTGGVLGFLFNDNNTSRSKIQLATIDGSGKLEMRSLAVGNSSDPDWLPRPAKQIGVRDVVVPCIRKKQICFAKVSFN